MIPFNAMKPNLCLTIFTAQQFRIACRWWFVCIIIIIMIIRRTKWSLNIHVCCCAWSSYVYEIGWIFFIFHPHAKFETLFIFISSLFGEFAGSVAVVAFNFYHFIYIFRCFSVNYRKKIVRIIPHGMKQDQNSDYDTWMTSIVFSLLYIS